MRKNDFRLGADPSFSYGIAHRGLHDETRTENGLNAFENAIDHGFAFELDIHLTRDGKLVVCHDSDLKRVTGKEGILEDLTLAEIEEGYRLLDGEKIPTFEEVLSLWKEQIGMVVELKVYRKNYKALAKAAKAALSVVKDKRKVLLISFDPRALFPFRKSGYLRQLLVCEKRKDVFFFRRFFEGADLEQCLPQHKNVRHYCKGHYVNFWTIETPEELSRVLPYADTVTFQKMDPALVRQAFEKKYGPYPGR